MSGWHCRHARTDELRNAVLGLFVDPAVDRLAVAFGLTDIVELMLAWRVAGYDGLDRYLLPLLGVP
ncbi:MAG: hypothetical protein WED12_02180 [Chloroflexota bacterium]